MVNAIYWRNIISNSLKISKWGRDLSWSHATYYRNCENICQVIISGVYLVWNMFRPYVDEPICDSPFTFRFEFRWRTINIKEIFIDQFANMSNPCCEAWLMQFSHFIIHLHDNTIIRHMMKTIDIAHSRHNAVYTRWQDSTFPIYHINHNIASSSFHIENTSTETQYHFINHRSSVLNCCDPKRHRRISIWILLLN